MNKLSATIIAAALLATTATALAQSTPSPEQRPAAGGRRAVPSPLHDRYGSYLVGSVKDAVTGRAIEGVTVGFSTEPDSQTFFATTVTDAGGAYKSPAIREGKYYLTLSKDRYINTKNVEGVVIDKGKRQYAIAPVAMSKSLPPGQYRIALTWGSYYQAEVKDVDTYLYIPGARMPVNFQNKEHSGAVLDIDDTDFAGPETTTIVELQPGTYKFLVDNFSHSHLGYALGRSQIKIDVYKGNEHMRHYEVPEGYGLAYEVFHIVDGDIVDVQEFRSQRPHGRSYW